MLCQRHMQVVLALCLLLVLWQCFRAPTDSLGPFPWAPSLLNIPTACCTAGANGSAWFNARYNMAMRPLLTGAAHELSSDVVQWWLVLILSPAFLKYIHDNWTQHHGRYPSTGFTALLFALHTCQQVSVFGFGADSEGNWHHYWEKNRWSGAFRRTRVHDADVEFSLIKRLAAEGRILFYK